jgi:hypothetical protein
MCNVQYLGQDKTFRDPCQYFSWHKKLPPIPGYKFCVSEKISNQLKETCLKLVFSSRYVAPGRTAYKTQPPAMPLFAM